MALTTKVYKTFLTQVLSRYPTSGSTSAIQSQPNDYPANGQYIVYPQDINGNNLASGFAFTATGLVVTNTSFSFIISPTTFHWPTISGLIRKFLIKQILPDTTQINCSVIDLGYDYAIDGLVDIDLTNSGFISFNSNQYV